MQLVHLHHHLHHHLEDLLHLHLEDLLLHHLEGVLLLHHHHLEGVLLHHHPLEAAATEAAAEGAVVEVILILRLIFN
jgi:hypothetical protein